MIVILILLLTAVFGPGFWSASIFKVNLKFIFIGISLLGAINQLGGYAKSILTEGCGRNGCTVANTSVIFPLFPLMAVVLPFCMIYSKSESTVYDDNITLFSMCFAAVGAKATNRVVIAHMSKSELGMWDWIQLSPLLMFINQYYNFWFDEYSVLVVATIYAYISLLIFCVNICWQFCDYLNIYCFKIRQPSNNLASIPSRSNLRTENSKRK